MGGEKNVQGSIYRRRIDALARYLADTGLDAAWIVQPENRRYLSGFKAGDPQFPESSGSLLISGNERYLVTDGRYVTDAEEEAVDFRVWKLKRDLLDEFPDLIRRLGPLGSYKMGFEEGYVTWRSYRRLTEKLDDLEVPVSLVPLDGVVEKMREVKGEEEIGAIETSADIGSRVLSALMDWVQPGVREKEVAWKIEDLTRQWGVEEGLAFPPIVASGPNAARPHAMPTSRKLEMNEPIVIDMGVKWEGYCSDMTRTVFLGDPDPFFKKVYSIVRKAQQAALDVIRPGVQTDLPDAKAREIIADAGFEGYFSHSLGHGVGLAPHERPRLSALEPVPLKEGSVVTVEPGIYIPHHGGIRLEEMVLVEKKGARVLTANDWLYDFGH